MTTLRIWYARAIGLLGGRHRDHQLAEEIGAHLELLAQEHMRRGLSAAQARAAARRDFGGVSQVQDAYRDQRGLPWIDDLWRDAGYALRALAKAPAFTAVAVVTLALGIGANAAIFSVVHAVLLNALPFPNAERLVSISGRSALGDFAAISPPDFNDYREQSASHVRLAAYGTFLNPASWVLNRGAQQLEGALVSAEFFETLGIEPLVGRGFTRADEHATTPQAAVLSYAIWQQELGGDRSMIGTTARMDGALVTIVGVMPPSFDFPANADFWIPAPMRAPGMQQRAGRFLRLIGSLQPGVTLAAGEVALNTIAGRLADAYPAVDHGWDVSVRPMRDAIVGPERSLLLLLFGAVVVVLLIACVNIANLLLAQNSARAKEFAIRISMGAGRGRLVRQLLTESVLLALIGGVMAAPLVLWGVKAIVALGAEGLPRLNEIHVDGTVVLFTAGLSVLTAVGVGLAPGWLAADTSLTSDLMEGGRAGVSVHRRRIGAGLIIGEMSLTLCLLIAAGLLLQSLWRILNVAPGFTADRVVTSRLQISQDRYPDAARTAAFMNRLFDGVGRLPGVQAVGAIGEMPLSGTDNSTWFRIAGRPQVRPDDKINADWRVASSGYFAAVGIGLVRGRVFATQDQDTSPRVVVIDKPFADKYFASEDPIGKHLSIWEGGADFVDREIIGIVGGVRHQSLRRPSQPTMYLPHTQARLSAPYLLVRGATNPAALTRPIREIVSRLDPDVAVPSFETMDDVVSRSASRARFAGWLFAAFALLGVALAAAGVYGVFSRVVTQQTREMGVRLALGASPTQVAGTVLGGAVRLAAVGLGLGLIAAMFLMRLLATQLYGVAPHDAATFIGSSALLLAVALIAAFIPARRAAQLDPAITLRYE